MIGKSKDETLLDFHENKLIKEVSIRTIQNKYSPEDKKRETAYGLTILFLTVIDFSWEKTKDGKGITVSLSPGSCWPLRIRKEKENQAGTKDMTSSMKV